MSEVKKNGSFSMNALAFLMGTGMTFVFAFIGLFIAMTIFEGWEYAKENAWLFSLVVATIGGFVFSYFINSTTGEAKRYADRIRAIKTKSGFDGTKSYAGTNFYIELHQNNDKILLVENNSYYVFRSDEIVDSELQIDNSVISRSTSNTGLSGAIVGGVIAGGAGAIVGAIASKKHNTTTSHTVENISIKLTTTQIENHYIELIFHSDYSLEKGSERLKNLLDKANNWHALFTSIIHISQRKETA